MSDEDLAVIREQYEATNRRDFGRVMELYAEDVVLHVPQVEGVQSPGTYEGKEAVGAWFGDWFQTFDRDYHFEIDDITEIRPGLIFMHATHGGRGRLSGAAVHGENAYLYRVRAGKISQVGFFTTREEALAAAALPEWSGGQTD